MTTPQLAFVDTETLGLDPDRHEVWKIAVIIPDGPHAGEHSWHIKVTNDQLAAAEEIALEINGFTNRYGRLPTVTPRESAERFAELVKGRHLVGAVPSFDEERLRRMHNLHLGRPHRYPWKYHLIDIESMMLGYLAGRGIDAPVPWRSEELSRLVDVSPPTGADRHSALGDARWVRDIYDTITRDVEAIA